MKYYVIKKRNKNKKLVKFNFEAEGYNFAPNIRNKNLITISHLSLFNKEMTEQVLIKKIDKSFRNLARLILQTLNDDNASAGEAVIALNELTKEKSVIERKYRNYLKKEEREKYLKRLKIMENELKNKIVYLKMIQNKEVEERGHSR